jgi:hypothetical protein
MMSVPQVKSVDWSPYIPTGSTFAVSAKVDHPQFRNTHYAAQVPLLHHHTYTRARSLCR